MIVGWFAGPGGWAEGLKLLGLREIGIELDEAACLTRAAAGHLTIRADVTTIDPSRWPKIEGVIASPPCPDFSSAGKRAGRTGKSGWMVDLVPRWVEAIRPEWVACEQVPEVLPIWQEHAARYRELGYSTWTGVLCAADYGIVSACPLHAMQPVVSAESLSRSATALVYAERLAMTSPDEAWPILAVTVAAASAKAIEPAYAGAATCAERVQALAALRESEGPTTLRGREVVSWTTEATSRFALPPGTAESIASLLSASLAEPSLARKWSTTSTETQRTTVLRTSRCIAATLITGLRTGPASRRGGCGLCVDVAVPQTRRRAILMASRVRPASPPEPTHAENPEPGLWGTLEPWVTMAQALGWIGENVDTPARTICGDRGPRWLYPDPDGTHGRQVMVLDRRQQNPDGSPVPPVPPDRPAPTLTAPGHRDRAGGERQFGEDTIKLTIEEALILQSFRPDYPLAGNKSQRFRQVGDAMPVLLGAHVAAALTGADPGIIAGRA